MFRGLFGKPRKPKEYEDQSKKDTKKEAKSLGGSKRQISPEDKDFADNEFKNKQERYALIWIGEECVKIQNGLEKSESRHLLKYFLESLQTLFHLRHGLMKIYNETGEQQESDFQALEVKQKLFDIDITSNRINFSKLENIGWILRFIDAEILKTEVHFDKKMPHKYHEMENFVESHNRAN